jgi:hypothetical protein
LDRTIVQMTFKVVIAYMSHQETDRLASWSRIPLQIPRSSHKTWIICITQKQVQSKTSATDDHREDSASNGIKEETSHPASNIYMTEQQGSSSFSANKICGHIFNDVKETDIAIKKSILTISDKLNRCVAEWVDADSALFVCLTLNPVVQTNRQNKIGYTFDISNYDEIFNIFVLEKIIRILTGRVICILQME